MNPKDLGFHPGQNSNPSLAYIGAWFNSIPQSAYATSLHICHASTRSDSVAVWMKDSEAVYREHPARYGYERTAGGLAHIPKVICKNDPDIG